MKSAIFILFCILFILIFNSNIVLGSFVEFNDYQIEKLSKLVPKECTHTGLFMCSSYVELEWERGNFLDLKNVTKDCVNEEQSLVDKLYPGLKNEIFSKGKLSKLTDKGLIPYEVKTNGQYSVLIFIENISESTVRKYLLYTNAELVLLPTPPLIGCINNKTNVLKALTVNYQNQVYWGDKLIKEPKGFISIGTFKISIFGGLSFITILSVTLITLLIRMKNRRPLSILKKQLAEGKITPMEYSEKKKMLKNEKVSK